MAKDLVRTRNAVKKFMLMKANIQAVSLKITTLKSNHAMAQAMKGVTKAMSTMNKKVNNNIQFLRIYLFILFFR
jgi:charged multivesicular body protein 2A